MFWTNQVQINAECQRKVGSGRRVAGAIRFLVNAMGLQFECARVLHEALFIPVLIHGRRRRIRAVQIGNLRGLLGIKRMDKVPNAQIRELYGVMKGMNETIEGVV